MYKENFISGTFYSLPSFLFNKSYKHNEIPVKIIQHLKKISTNLPHRKLHLK